ncbi:hypothetical protein ACLBWS_03730 [Brucellaceae bacterium D45D]
MKSLNLIFGWALILPVCVTVTDSPSANSQGTVSDIEISVCVPAAMHNPAASAELTRYITGTSCVDDTRSVDAMRRNLPDLFMYSRNPQSLDFRYTCLAHAFAVLKAGINANGKHNVLK